MLKELSRRDRHSFLRVIVGIAVCVLGFLLGWLVCGTVLLFPDWLV